MELREEEREVGIAIVYVLDRSGSMAAEVSGNIGSLQKMDLANEGTARSLMLLGRLDNAAIVAVDDSPEIIAPLTKVIEDRLELSTKARSIRSSGGGIFVYEGLKAGWEVIKNASQKKKHIVLFADAADAEEPGDYHTLLRSIREAGGSVSVIALGSRHDRDASLLEEIASLGEGKVFFVAEPMDLPGVFSQETIRFSRSLYEEQQASLSVHPSWALISPDRPPQLTNVFAYNINYARPEAVVLYSTKTETPLPMAAVWQQQAGRVGAVSFPLIGKNSELHQQQSELKHFVTTLTRWLLRPKGSSGLSLSLDEQENTLLINFSFAPSWQTIVDERGSSLTILTSTSSPYKIPWRVVRPGQLTASIPLVPDVPVAGIVQIGHEAVTFGPYELSQSAEFSFDQESVQRLRTIAAASDGKEVANLSDVWQTQRKLSNRSLRPLVVMIVLLLFLLEISLQRLNISVQWMSWIRRQAKFIRTKLKNKPKEQSQLASAVDDASLGDRGSEAAVFDRSGHSSFLSIDSAVENEVTPPSSYSSSALSDALKKAKRRGL
jgi:hypothetical protein